MEQVSIFSIKKSRENKSKLILNGRELADIDGVILETQFSLDSGQYLILTTDGCPFEEGLHLILLDQTYRIIDQVNLSQDYTSGQLDDVQIVSNSVLEFSFQGQTKTKVVILSEGKRVFFPSLKGNAQRDFNPFKKQYMEVI